MLSQKHTLSLHHHSWAHSQLLSYFTQKVQPCTTIMNLFFCLLFIWDLSFALGQYFLCFWSFWSFWQYCNDWRQKKRNFLSLSTYSLVVIFNSYFQPNSSQTHLDRVGAFIQYLEIFSWSFFGPFSNWTSWKVAVSGKRIQTQEIKHVWWWHFFASERKMADLGIWSKWKSFVSKYSQNTGVLRNTHGLILSGNGKNKILFPFLAFFPGICSVIFCRFFIDVQGFCAPQFFPQAEKKAWPYQYQSNYFVWETGTSSAVSAKP